MRQRCVALLAGVRGGRRSLPAGVRAGTTAATQPRETSRRRRAQLRQARARPTDLHGGRSAVAVGIRRFRANENESSTGTEPPSAEQFEEVARTDSVPRDRPPGSKEFAALGAPLRTKRMVDAPSARRRSMRAVEEDRRPLRDCRENAAVFAELIDAQRATASSLRRSIADRGLAGPSKSRAFGRATCRLPPLTQFTTCSIGGDFLSTQIQSHCSPALLSAVGACSPPAAAAATTARRSTAGCDHARPNSSNRATRSAQPATRKSTPDSTSSSKENEFSKKNQPTQAEFEEGG